MGTPKRTLTALFILSSVCSFGQNDFSAKTWMFIDTSIAFKRNLNNLGQTVKTLEKKAWSEKKYFYAARCLQYGILITDRKTEDSLYFKNSVLLDEQLAKPQQPEYEYALHLLQAARLHGFSRVSGYNHSRYERKDLPVNYAAFKQEELDSIADIHFEKAKALAKAINVSGTDEAIWLSSNPLQFLFRPGLFDIAIAGQIAVKHKSYLYDSELKDVLPGWISFSPDKLLAASHSEAGKPNSRMKELKLYNEWAAYHSASPAEYYFIESLLHKYIYSLVSDYGRGEKQYEAYLTGLAASPHNMVKANGIYQLCTIWAKQATRYFPGYRNYNFSDTVQLPDSKKYDTLYRFHAAKALKLFEQNKALLDSFYYLKDVLQEMEAGIMSSEVNITLPQTTLINEPFLAEVKFKNTDTLHYRIVRSGHDGRILTGGKEELKYYLSKPAVKEKMVMMPSTGGDHNHHNLYLPMEAMQPGSYTILFSPHPVDDTLFVPEQLDFSVSNIVLRENKKRVYVLDRKTGKPITGAKITAVYNKENTRGLNTTYQRLTQQHKLSPGGFFDLKDTRYNQIEVSNGADSLTEEFVSLDEEEEANDEIYKKDDYDDLVDFYQQKAKVYVHTDRGIYRPGQTVYFKAIFFTNDKNTGQAVLMTEANMRDKLMGSVFRKWLKESKPYLYINDPFDKIIDSVKIEPNEYGSVSGSFKIPKTAATGEWSIEDGFSDNYTDFKVEEYKRPTYEVNIENPVAELKPKDTFSFKVKVKSFAGSPMNGVRVSYTIQRTGYLPAWPAVTDKSKTGYYNDTIIAANGLTDNEGRLTVVVNDTALAKFTLDNKESWRLYYEIDAEAEDATGESYTASSRLDISNRPVQINLAMNNTYRRSEIDSVEISTYDENAGPVYKQIKLKAYKKKRDIRIFRDRTYTKADTWLYEKEDLQKQFPEEDLLQQKEKEPVQPTEELIWEKTITTAPNSRFDLNSKEFPAGEYVLKAVCEENGSITGEMAEDFEVFDDKEGKMPAEDNLFHHIKNGKVKPGETVPYFYGSSLGETFSVFQCRYFSKNKKLKEEYFFSEKRAAPGLQRYDLKVPANAEDKLLLTHWFILNNELHSTEEELEIETEEMPKPEIIVEKYRKKLTPGSKETFTVSIKTKDQKTAAELMTTMYDASLDKLATHNWEALDLNYTYRSLYNNWGSDINSFTRNNSSRYYREADFVLPEHAKRTAPLWWLNPLDYAYSENSGRYAYMLGLESEADYPSAFRGNNYRKGNIGGFVFQHDMNPDARWVGGDQLELTAGIGGGLGIINTAVPFLRIGNGAFASAFTTSVLANQQSQRFLPGAQSLFGVKSGLFSSVSGVTVDNIHFNYTLANTDFSKDTKLDYNSNYVWYDKSAGEAGMNSDYSVKLYELITNDTILPKEVTFVVVNDALASRNQLASLDKNNIFSVELLSAKDAEALFGKQAAKGAIIVTTKDYLAFLQGQGEPVKTRKNFNETAFFYPAIYADKNGYYTFSFTMPESVTEWNWKMLAHTKNAVFAYAEKKLNSQLPLMVQPNMPRLLYQGDRIVLQSRITNLDTAKTSGKITCKIEDAVTGDDITSRLLAVQQNNFAVDRKANTASAFELKVPANQQNPLKVIITVRSGNFADGEEHILPVLSSKVFVKDSKPFYFKTKNDTTVQLPKLPAGAEMYGVGLSIKPQAQAALINSLPYLSSYPYWCAEQTINKMLAYAVACKLIRDDTSVQHSFEQAKAAIEKDKTEKEKLPTDPDSYREADETMPWLGLSNNTADMQHKLFNLLDTSKSKQVIDELFKKIQKMQKPDGGIAWFSGGKSNSYISSYLLMALGKLRNGGLLVTEDLTGSGFDSFIEKLVAYSDKDFADPHVYYGGRDTLSYIYGRGYWLQEYPISAAASIAIAEYLQSQFKNIETLSLYRQAQFIIAAFQVGHHENMLQEIAHIRLRNIREQAIEDEEYGLRWKELADTDDLTNSSEETIALLSEAFEAAGYTAVQEGLVKWLLAAKNDHSWTNTKGTAAAINLLLQQNKSATNKQTVTGKVGGNTISAVNDLLGGSSFDFVKTNSNAEGITLLKQTGGEASGNIYSYYFTSSLQPELLNKDVQLRKEFYKWDEKINQWLALKEGDNLKLTDKVKVVISITTSRFLQYVFIDDKRAALFEPLNNNSGYEYTDRLSYYQSVRDAGYQFFADNIPSGKSEISYELKVAHEGSFISGPAVLQCMYKPEVTAYSNSVNFISVK